MAMTHRERILAALRNQPHDYLAWAPRIDLWYDAHAKAGTLPQEYQGWSMWDIVRDIGGGLQGTRGVIYREQLKDIEVKVRQEPHQTITEYHTPLGVVTTELALTDLLDETGTRAYETGKMFKRVEDYPVIEYIFEHTEIIPAYDEFHRLAQQIGEDGVVHGQMGYSPMHRVMREIMGYERFVYEYADHRDQVEHLYEVMMDHGRRIARVAADSPATVITSCGNWSDMIHTPTLFRRYYVPWFQELGALLHPRGKLIQSHIDGEMRRLLDATLEAGIDVGEAFSPAPMTSLTCADLRQAWGDRIAVWGGVPSQLFTESYTDEEFDAYILKMFREIQPGQNFVVGTGDNLPIHAVFHRLARITELVQHYGKLPMRL